MEYSISPGELPARAGISTEEHDATLLAAALDDLEAQRAAIEGMLEADLLSLLLT